jgi:hypothetical protein
MVFQFEAVARQLSGGLLCGGGSRGGCDRVGGSRPQPPCFARACTWLLILAPKKRYFQAAPRGGGKLDLSRPLLYYFISSQSSYRITHYFTEFSKAAWRQLTPV